MKKTAFLLLSLVCVASSARAEPILLDREEITLQSASAILVRNEKSPKKVRLTMPIPATETDCVGGWTVRRQVTEISAGNCPNYGGMRAGHDGGYSNIGCRRSPEYVCNGYAKKDVTAWKKVVLKFRDSADVVGGEEQYELVGAQNPEDESDFDFSLRSMSIGARHEIKKRSGMFLVIRLGPPKFIVR
ncbi:MAG: hypothetical protein JST04_05195 [Bdellovibrionales bacterium]|nr:hypothetical protein [Bdellovibrionales bacterium]